MSEPRTPATIPINVRPDEDAIRAVVTEYTHHPYFVHATGGAAPWAWHWLIPGCVAGGAAAAWFMWRQSHGSLPAAIAGGVVGPAIVIFFQMHRSHGANERVRTAARQIIAAFIDHHRREPIRQILLSEDGVTVRHPEYHVGYAWTSIRRVRAPDAGLVIETWNGTMYLAPAASFPSRGAIDDAAAYAQARVDRAGTGEAAVNRKRLADHLAACLACGYSLHGCAGDACPECGVTLKAEQFGISHAGEPAPQ